MTQVVFTGRLFVQYGQFYLWDAVLRPDAPTDYEDEDIECGIKEADGIVAILPPRNGTIDLTVELVDRQPVLGQEWQRITTGKIATRTGVLELIEWPDQVRASITTPSGTLSVTYAYSGMTDDIAEREAGDDRHHVWITAPSVNHTVP